ncbi:porin family protein [Bosea sp. BH3]|nr:porin family protein [Bosea sp. BH3]
MKTFVSFAAAAGFLYGSAALAADLPSRQYVAPVAVPPAFTWTGFYVGANAGYVWSENRSRYSYALTNPADFADFNALALVPQSLGRNGNGFVGGGQIGYNYQIDRFVLGAEADIQYLDGRQQSSWSRTLSDAVGTATVTTTARSSIDWLGTVRARAGYAFDRTLVYATGGLAYGRTKDASSIIPTGSDDDGPFQGLWTGRKAGTRAGWTLGGGVEYAITDNLTLKGEYLYYDLGRTKYVLSGFSTDPDDEFLGATVRRKTSGSIVRAGLNWKFSTF